MEKGQSAEPARASPAKARHRLRVRSPAAARAYFFSFFSPSSADSRGPHVSTIIVIFPLIARGQLADRDLLAMILCHQGHLRPRQAPPIRALPSLSLCLLPSLCIVPPGRRNSSPEFASTATVLLRFRRKP